MAQIDNWEEKLEKKYGHLTVILNNNSDNIDDWEDVSIVEIIKPSILEEIALAKEQEKKRIIEIIENSKHTVNLWGIATVFREENDRLDELINKINKHIKHPNKVLLFDI